MERAGLSRRAPASRVRAPAADERVARVRFLARLLDNQFRIPGTDYRIGIDPLIGLVPGIGDAVSALLAAWILVSAARIGAPPAVLARMGLNLAIDSLVGLVPVLGDLFDAGYKANARNLRLLEGWVGQPAPARRASRAVVLAVVLGVLAIVIAVLYAAWKLVAWAARTVSAA